MSNKTTFLSFAQNKKIEIPIFQRDYAQGRNDETTDKIRKDFVSSLIEALDKNTPIELDFIYGREVDNTITLIDGQQRLTTLFLLHWYLAQRIGKIDAFKNIKFSYATRDYAKDFTAKLTIGEDFKIDFTQATSTELKDKNWFYDDWQHDPTVSGMLNMLDEIHKQLRDKTIEHYWSLLEQGIITFYWLDLEEYQLTDELYLKMNARGKQLSKVENFKASLVKRINDEQWESKEKVKETFSYKMDTTYTDLFWKYRGDMNVIDYEVTNFFAGMAMIGYALKENSEAQQERIQELFKNPLSVRVEDFEERDFNLFMSYLDFYSTVENISIETDLWEYYNTNNKRGFFEEFIKDENKGTQKAYRGATYKQRIFFYAITNLFIKVKDNKAKIEEFIQVVRNIIENEAIDSAETFAGAIKLMRELLDGSPDIYDYLSKTAIQSKFASYQVAQEIDKAKRIVADSQWKEAIWKAENHLMFKGDIGFLLLETENNLDLFKKRYQVAKEMFDKDGVTDKYKENMLLIRALISRFDQWHLVTHGFTFDCEKETWKKILEYKNYWAKYFLKLLDSATSLKEFIKQPSQIIDRERPHQELYQTQLLEAVEERRRNYDYWKRKISYHGRHKYILYYDKSKTEDFRYIFADDRNEKLAKAVEKGIITTEQQLEVNGEKIPFFWGWDIKFTYKEEVYIWRYQYFDDIVKEANKEICTEEAMQNIFSSSL